MTTDTDISDDLFEAAWSEWGKIDQPSYKEALRRALNIATFALRRELAAERERVSFRIEIIEVLTKERDAAIVRAGEYAEKIHSLSLQLDLQKESRNLRAMLDAAQAEARELREALEVAHAYARQCGWHLAVASSDDSVEKDFAERLVAAADMISAVLSKYRINAALAGKG